MAKKVTREKLLFILFIALGGFIIFIVLGNGFGSDSAPYKIDSVEMKTFLDNTGNLHIMEKTKYEIKGKAEKIMKSLHLSYPYILNDFNMEADVSPENLKELSYSSNGFDIEILIDDPQRKEVTIDSEYTLSGAAQIGEDIARLSFRFWEPVPNVSTKKITLEIELPEEVARYVEKKNLTIRPYKSEKISIDGNRITIVMKSILANAFAEVSITLPKEALENMKNTVPMDFSEETLRNDKNENLYRKSFLTGIAVFQIIVPIFVIILVFFLFGTEPQLKLKKINIPDDAEGYLINTAVKNTMSGPDINGYLASVIEMIDNGSILIEDGNFFINNTPRLSEDYEQAKRVLMSLASDNVFNPADCVKKGYPNNERSQVLKLEYELWKKTAIRSVKSKKFFEHLGATMMSAFSLMFMIFWSVILKFFFANWHVYLLFPNQSFGLSVVLYIDWIIGWLLLLTPKDLFGRWTPSGRLFYMEWRNYEDSLSEKETYNSNELKYMIALGHFEELLGEDNYKLSKDQKETISALNELKRILWLTKIH